MSIESTSGVQPRWDRFPLVAAHKIARRQLIVEAGLGLSPNTIEAYGRAREDFLGFCAGQKIEPVKANREVVALWVRDLLHRPTAITVDKTGSGSRSGLSNSTIQQKTTAVRLFFEYLIDQGLCTSNPVGYGRYAPGRSMLGRRGLVPRHRKLPWIPGDEEWQAMVRAATSAPLRNRVMFCLAYDAALRREELCSLAIDDFDFAHRILTVRAEVAKGRRQRMVPYSETSALLLTAYLKHRRTLTIRPGATFLSESRRNRGEPITIWTWSKAVEELSTVAEVANFTTHTFRHLCLTDLARSGWDIHEIAVFAGHRSIETTKDYIHLSARDLAAKVQKGMDQLHAWRLKMLGRAIG